MALVAYSDESDYSEEEENQSSSLSASSFTEPLSNDKIQVSNITERNKPSSSLANGKILSGVESIELDDDDFVVPAPKSSSKINSSNSLLSTLPAASSSRSRSAVLAVDDSDDQLTDVPTKETWQPAQDVLKKGLLNGKAGNSALKPSVSRGTAGGKSGSDAGAAARGLSKVQQIALESSALGSLLLEKKTVGGKIQLHLPAMTEFAEEEEDETAGQVVDAGESTRTKRGPSNTGTGLFSLLPKPKNAPKGKEANRSLVPHILSKPPVKRHVPVKTKKPPGATPKVPASTKTSAISGLGDYEASDEDDDGSDGPSDFFSLEADNSIVVPADKGSFSVGSSEIVNELADVSVRLPSSSFVPSGPVAVPVSSPSSSHNYHPTDSDEVRLEPSATATHDANSAAFEAQTSQDQLDPSQIDDEAWRRLTGKKRKAEDLNIIDFNPDDALLSRDELMNQVISQQKPNQSHSKKKGNLPSHQQKRKHQITYLAHQAKEREIELQNEWSTGKAKKMQTRAKYGF